MRMYDLIVKKRDGHELNREEIYWFIDKYTRGDVPDYQASALLMAIFIRGMSDSETLELTNAMTYSGDVLDLSDIEGVKADKHSTGGVGDKTSLILAPLVASCGVTMAKMSGRGLGHTGGTIDKLESIPGFNTSLTTEEFKNNLKCHGIALMGQTLSLAPADKKLYALRDVTGTVENMSLIASSIMSKKLAAGADVIVLDVKTGSGAFMKNYSDALVLAEKMTWLGRRAGRRVAAVISDMDQPLGCAVGNALEVKEAIATLKGSKDKGPSELRELCLCLGSLILTQTGKCRDDKEAGALLTEKLDKGEAFEKFREFVAAQGGDLRVVDDPGLLPTAPIVKPLLSPAKGFVKSIDCLETGLCSLLLGGGRATKEDVIDLSVGIVLGKKVGDEVDEGEALAWIHASYEASAKSASKRLAKAFVIDENRQPSRKLIRDIID